MANIIGYVVKENCGDSVRYHGKSVGACSGVGEWFIEEDRNYFKTISWAKRCINTLMKTHFSIYPITYSVVGVEEKENGFNFIEL